MSEEEKNDTTPKFRGLYSKVNISVKALDRIIVACIAVILIVLAINLQDPGFLVTFDSQGGTPVTAEKFQYHETLADIEEPTREGYTFTGWYYDPACTLLWENDTKVEKEVTLYAGWKKK